MGNKNISRTEPACQTIGHRPWKLHLTERRQEQRKTNVLSSIMSVFTRLHRSNTVLFGCPRILPLICLAVSFPIPIPAQECNVHPPMFIAAMPVDAVIPSAFVSRSLNSLIISRSSTDLPVPADPEKKMLPPCFIRSRTAFCSAESDTFGAASIVVGAGLGGALDFTFPVWL